jgi:hypothetical protein
MDEEKKNFSTSRIGCVVYVNAGQRKGNCWLLLLYRKMCNAIFPSVFHRSRKDKDGLFGGKEKAKSLEKICLK